MRIRNCARNYYLVYNYSKHTKHDNIFSGNCCWKLYTRRYFRGRKTIVAGNIEVRTLRRLGRGNRKIRSVKQYASCEDML